VEDTFQSNQMYEELCKYQKTKWSFAIVLSYSREIRQDSWQKNMMILEWQLFKSSWANFSANDWFATSHEATKVLLV